MSDQVTSGTVAKPSRFDDGWTSFRASVKSAEVMHRGASWASVSGSGCALRKWAIELADDWKDMFENGVLLGMDTGIGLGAGGSASIDTSIAFASIGSGRISVPSESCLNIRLTARIPAAPVKAAKSAPTYPGVALARATKLKSPSSLNLADRTRRILTQRRT